MSSFDLGYAPSQYRSSRPGYDGTSLQAFFDAFPDDDACLRHVFKIRFGSDPTCPRCGKNGRWRQHETQKHFFHPCGGILSPMSCVVFSRSRIPLQLWFYAMLHFANSPEGISASFLARQLGVSDPTSFRISNRIRWHMAQIDAGQKLGGPQRDVIVRIIKVLRIQNKKANQQNSASVLLLSDSQRVSSTIIRERRRSQVRKIIQMKTTPDSNLVTDCFWTSRLLCRYGSNRPLAQFVPRYFDGRPGSENLNHGFMQYFNLSFADQFRGVSLENAWLYFKEYEFRFNRRADSSWTFWDMANNFPVFEDSAMQAVRAQSSLQRTQS